MAWLLYFLLHICRCSPSWSGEHRLSSSSVSRSADLWPPEALWWGLRRPGPNPAASSCLHTSAGRAPEPGNILDDISALELHIPTLTFLSHKYFAVFTLRQFLLPWKRPRIPTQTNCIGKYVEMMEFIFYFYFFFQTSVFRRQNHNQLRSESVGNIRRAKNWWRFSPDINIYSLS